MSQSYRRRKKAGKLQKLLNTYSTPESLPPSIKRRVLSFLHNYNVGFVQHTPEGGKVLTIEVLNVQT